MKSSIGIAAVFVLCGTALGASATFAVQPFVGSDTELNMQNQAIENSGLGDTGWTSKSTTADYTGGGSGAAEAAMVAGTQDVGPMTRMLKGGAGKNACAYTGSLADASGIVIGIDAARVFASASVVNTTAANGGAVTVSNACLPTVAGLVYDQVNNPVSLGTAAGGTSNGFQNWRDALALLYGGLDKDNGLCNVTGAGCNPYNAIGSGNCTSGTDTACNPITDCTAVRRRNLIANWSAFFENSGVTNSNGSALTHAFRRDDTSGTSDVFSNLLGMQSASVDQFNNKIAGFSLSSEAINSFGTSPYCNVLNWDVNEASAGKCAKGLCSVDGTTTCTTPGASCTVGSTTGTCVQANDRHYQGPGGIPLPSTTDPNCVSTAKAGSLICHHVPPFTCAAAPLLCPNGSSCTTAGATCPAGGTCATASDNRCPAGQTISVSVYGSADYATQPSVFPTSYQDNDPLRTACLGTGARSPAEDVCNTDGNLGVVLPIPPLDFVPNQNPGVTSYTGSPKSGQQNSACQNLSAAQPTQCSNGAVAASAPLVYTCAPKGTQGNGLCPDNDVALAIGCLVPQGQTATGSGIFTTQCWSVNSTSVGCFTGQQQTGGTPCGIDGRIYNEQVYNGVAGATTTTAYINFTVGGVSLNDTGGYGRIHQKDTSVSGVSVCQLTDVDQQIGCLVQADPNALGYGGNDGDTWEASDPLSNGSCSAQTSGLRVHEIAAGVACVPLQSGAGQCDTGAICSPVGSTCADSSTCTAVAQYPLWRKVYLNTIIGFGNIPTTLPHLAELQLAGWETQAADISPIITQYNDFELPFSPAGTNGSGLAQPFCEDFNEYLNACVTTGSGNQNACLANSSVAPTLNSTTYQFPTASTVCGNGVLEDFEDCDPGTPSNGSAGAIAPASNNPTNCGTCSTICRCSLL